VLADKGHIGAGEHTCSSLPGRNKPLVAAGRSNRDIAGELFISGNTASVHVSNILAKLGVTQPHEAAATAHRIRLLDSSRRSTDRHITASGCTRLPLRPKASDGDAPDHQIWIIELWGELDAEPETEDALSTGRFLRHDFDGDQLTGFRLRHVSLSRRAEAPAWALQGSNHRRTPRRRRGCGSALCRAGLHGPCRRGSRDVPSRIPGNWPIRVSEP
jgi:Bacterial regulatory proteins, luxR family